MISGKGRDRDIESISFTHLFLTYSLTYPSFVYVLIVMETLSTQTRTGIHEDLVKIL